MIIADALPAAGPASPAADHHVPFAAVLDPDSPGEPDGGPLLGVKADRDTDLFWSAPATGVHEQVSGGPEAWREAMRAHTGAACLHVVARGDGDAELYALPFVPAEIARERERFGAYATRTMGGNLLADLLQEEVRKRERVVAIDHEAVLLSAFAARAPYQLMIVPRTPRARFEDDGPIGAALLADALRRLDGRPLQLWVRTAPSGAEHFCWRIDLVPAAAGPGGLEAGTGVPVNPVSPERAAAELRD